MLLHQSYIHWILTILLLLSVKDQGDRSEAVETREMRELAVDERLEAAMDVKSRGNKLFKDNNYMDANTQYERAFGLFKCVTTTSTVVVVVIVVVIVVVVVVVVVVVEHVTRSCGGDLPALTSSLRLRVRVQVVGLFLKAAILRRLLDRVLAALC